MIGYFYENFFLKCKYMYFIFIDIKLIYICNIMIFVVLFCVNEIFEVFMKMMGLRLLFVCYELL